MSQLGYAVTKSSTPELWLDDGYACITTNDVFTKVCGLGTVDSLTQTATGVITLNLASFVNVLGVHPSVVGAATTDLGCTVVSVSTAGTNNNGNPTVQIILQVFTCSTGAATSLTYGQGLCIDIRYNKSSIIFGTALQQGMVQL